ncbi:inositol polyphosphate multikinase IPK2-like [Zingiber officinale]|uniref:Inositol polyphosphate multikinase n=1 Tax=Zingiber officinale TaxID=94328 RepID=A0A8J5FTG8_ZINOF|nr:inositol polyphosphate multikinase IPK2-like [Zingiber officinale]KAG6492630.1 hypothetical protein ZIOFF_047595 [Zingiber officinale]
MASPILKPPEHQVAGHSAKDGKLGPLVDGRGLFYKPLQGDGRGDSELSFYAAFFSHPAVPPAIRSFFPGFHGTHFLPSSDGSGPRPHLALDDLLPAFRSPSIIDLKIGACTWPPDSPDDYFRKCIARDRESASPTLGFRVSGVQIQNPGVGADSFWRPLRSRVRVYSVEETRRVLRQFVSRNSPSTDEKLDCDLASVVYGAADGVLAQLQEIKAWFEEQTIFHFYSTSILLIYEKDAAAAAVGRSSGVRVKLVDFAHVVEGNGIIDHNFLGGLSSLIKLLFEVITDPEGDGWKASKVHLSCNNGSLESNASVLPST